MKVNQTTRQVRMPAADVLRYLKWIKSEISQTMTNKLTRPPGPIMRRIEGVVVCISGLGCFLVYALIEFDLCATRDCGKLVVTKFHASLPEMYLVYGLACLSTGVFLYSDKHLNKISRLGIEGAVLIGFVLSGMVLFGMLIEMKNVT